MRSLLATTLAIALAAAMIDPRPADACSCAPPGVEVIPSGRGAPTNSRVRILVPDGDWAPDIRRVNAVLRPKKGTTKSIREGTGKKKKWRTITIPAPAVLADRLDVGAGARRIIELAPKEALLPKTDYVVLLQADGGREEIVGEFETGSAPDTRAPAWNGVTKAVYASDERVCCTCATGDPYATLTLSPISDERDPVIYGLWLESDDGQIHYEKPPLTYVTARGDKLKLGHWSQCAPPNFQFPDGVERLVIGVRAFDVAGNAADTAGEVVLELVKNR